MRGEHLAEVDLDRLGLLSGQGKQLRVAVRPGQIELGGHTYSPEPAEPEACIDVSRTVSGYALRIRFEAEMRGPCMRCLETATVGLAVDAREVDQPVEPVPGTDEDGESELLSPYVDESVVDVGRWARDALVLALPDPILCVADCAGLCAVCGERLADSDPADHRHAEAGDPRWAKLRELGGGSG